MTDDQRHNYRNWTIAIAVALIVMGLTVLAASIAADALRGGGRFRLYGEHASLPLRFGELCGGFPIRL